MLLMLTTIILASLLLSLSYVDWKEFRLPNSLTLALVTTGLLQSYWFGLDLKNSILGVIIGYLFFVGVELAFKRLRGIEGLGRGDAKLLAGGGAWCGWMGLPFIVLIASGLGLVAALFPSVRNMESEKIPFGPFLSLAIFIVWMATQRVYYSGL